MEIRIEIYKGFTYTKLKVGRGNFFLDHHIKTIWPRVVAVIPSVLWNQRLQFESGRHNPVVRIRPLDITLKCDPVHLIMKHSVEFTTLN